VPIVTTKTDQQFVEQLQAVIAAVTKIMRQSRYDDLSDLSEADIHLGLSRLRAAVERTSSADSPYIRELNKIDKKGWRGGEGLAMYRGVTQSLLDDLEAGYAHGFRELVHADVFADYLDMAQHLLDSGYKDASAVIAGSTLEGHLRNLCRKHGISVERVTPQGNVSQKSDTLNAELAKAQAYGKLDQKAVTAWLDLRNKAAHGHYAEYTIDQVRFSIAAIRDFIARLPA
jgi:hypothetical protein